MPPAEPGLLISDESTSALDAVVRHCILESIDEPVRLGRGIAGRPDGQARIPTCGACRPACRPSLDHPGAGLPELQREDAWLP